MKGFTHNNDRDARDDGRPITVDFEKMKEI
jgi:hypothetical protein